MIGYYVHHQGRGHLTRCRAVLEHLPSTTVLSSLPPQAGIPWLQLADDATGVPSPPSSEYDVTAHGALHWAPRRHAGLRRRMAQLAAWVEEHDPAAVVVDVSVEVTVFLRTMGVPVVTMTLPGRRDDPPHELAHRLADRIIATWPAELSRPAHLEPHQDRVVHTGAVSAYDGRPAPRVARSGRRRALFLAGAGGTSLDETPTIEGWDVVAVGGAHGWVEDLWPELHAADVVVSHAGQGAVADVAAAGRPLVVVPEPRPFDEQHATADVLAQAGLAVRADDWADVTAEQLEAAIALRPDWTRWRTAGAARRVAAAIEEVAQA